MAVSLSFSNAVTDAEAGRLLESPVTENYNTCSNSISHVHMDGMMRRLFIQRRLCSHMKTAFYNA